AEEVPVDLEALAVDREPAVADAVRVAAHNGAEIGRMGRIVFKAIEAQNEGRVMARHPQVLQDRAPGKDGGGKPAALDGVTLDGLAVFRSAESLALHAAGLPLYLQAEPADANIFRVEVVFDALVAAFAAEAR